MKKMLLILIFLLRVSDANSDTVNGYVSEGIQPWLVFQQTFSIFVTDQVKDSCLPYPNKLKDKMEIALRKAGFNIDEGPGIHGAIFITALGYQTTPSNCVVDLKANLLIPTVALIPFTYATSQQRQKQGYVYFPYEIGNVVLTGPKSNMQDRLEKEVDSYGESLFLDISRARDVIFKKYPDIKAAFDRQKIK